MHKLVDDDAHWQFLFGWTAAVESVHCVSIHYYSAHLATALQVSDLVWTAPWDEDSLTPVLLKVPQLKLLLSSQLLPMMLHQHKLLCIYGVHIHQWVVLSTNRLPLVCEFSCMLC